MKRLGIIICLVLACFCGWCGAATWYCDAAATGTNNDGNEADPYSEVDINDHDGLTKQWAPGDTIYCKGKFGVITIDDHAYGSAGGGYVTWAAWPGFTPDCNNLRMNTTQDWYLKIEGWNFDRGWANFDDPHSQWNDTITLENGSYFWLKDCTVEGLKSLTPAADVGEGDFYPYGFFRAPGGQSQSYKCIDASGGGPNEVTIDGCEFSYASHALYISKAGTWDINDCNIHRIYGDGIQCGGSSGDPPIINVEDCEIHNLRPHWGSYRYDGVATGTWAGHEFETVTHDNTNTSGIYMLGGDGGTIFIVGDDEDNLIKKGTANGYTNGSKWILDSNNAIFYTLDGTGQDNSHNDGISFSGDIGSGTAENPNTISRTAIYDYYNQALIFNNDDPAPVFATFENCWIVHTQTTGNVIGAARGTLVFNNNTILSPGGPDVNFNTGVISVAAHNNIWGADLTKGTGASFDFANNLFYDSVGNIDANFTGAGDVYDHVAADLFTDVDTYDLTLIADCNAIDVANATYAPATDYAGTARPQGNGFDIGAYEWIADDGLAPSPDPLTWSSEPAAASTTSITMTATTATDVSGVEYSFECTSGGGHNSGWQDAALYIDTGLTQNTAYTYRCQARDKSAGQNTTGWSSSVQATTTAEDTTAPTPNPMTFATAPYALNSSSIAMIATTATDTSGVEYLFTETSGNPGGTSSDWQDSANYTDTGLSAATQYTYTVTARDKSTNQNSTSASTPASATTKSVTTNAYFPGF